LEQEGNASNVGDAGGLMRVLTLTPFYPTASDDAAGCFTAEPLPVLEKLGVKSYVVAVQPFFRASAQPNHNSHPADWVRYPCLPGGIGLSSAGRFLYSRLISEVRKMHRLRPFDLIHAHAALPCGHAAALLSRDLGIRSVITVHGLDAYFNRQVQGVAGGWCERLARFVYQTAASVIGISGRVRDQITNGQSSPIRTTVIYNGVDAARFYPAQGASDEPVILSVGNLIPIKGHDVLLRAFAGVHKRFPAVRCDIIGDGPERSRLGQLARELGIAFRVRFLGRQSRSQVAHAMQRCSIFALPSRYEGLGCVYLEAMSAQKPVVACRGQGIAEIIRHRRNGLLVDANDPGDLATALTALLEDTSLRRQLGEQARRTVVESFTLDHQAARLADLYRECIA
jgi:teichuronic acid biosynthesis glycosyltransferase TuaC